MSVFNILVVSKPTCAGSHMSKNTALWVMITLFSWALWSEACSYNPDLSAGLRLVSRLLVHETGGPPWGKNTSRESGWALGLKWLMLWPRSPSMVGLCFIWDMGLRVGQRAFRVRSAKVHQLYFVLPTRRTLHPTVLLPWCPAWAVWLSTPKPRAQTPSYLSCFGHSDLKSNEYRFLCVSNIDRSS